MEGRSRDAACKQIVRSLVRSKGQFDRTSHGKFAVHQETPELRSRIMRENRSKDTKPELAVRRLAHGMGYRYRLHRHDLPGRPDLVFPGRRKVIFVHGCFWHQHADPACKSASLPKSNRDYWIPKLERNAARDAEHLASLAESGWDVLVLWECEVRGGDGVPERIREFLERDCKQGSTASEGA